MLFFSSLVKTIHADAPEEQKVSDSDSPDGVPVNAEPEPEEEEEPEDVCFLLSFLLVAHAFSTRRSTQCCVKRHRSHPSARPLLITSSTARRRSSQERASSMRIV
jgi:hypothetical protein